jgi:hypothetical protein
MRPRRRVTEKSRRSTVKILGGWPELKIGRRIGSSGGSYAECPYASGVTPDPVWAGRS